MWNTQRDKFGLSEMDYVEKCLRFALQLIDEDLKLNCAKFGLECTTLETLGLILRFHDTMDEKDNEAQFSHDSSSRMDKILAFQRIKGFYHIAIYFNARCGTASFPDWILVHHVLKAALDGIVSLEYGRDGSFLDNFCTVATNMVGGVTKHLNSLTVDALVEVKVNHLWSVMLDLTNLSEVLGVGSFKTMPKYADFCQGIVHKLLSSKSEEHKEVGSTLLQRLILTIYDVRPLISAFVVKRAGLAACNGMYIIASSSRDRDGYMVPGLTPQYERYVKGTNLKFVLHVEKGTSSQRRWYLSEEHSDESSIEYEDYYTNDTGNIGRTPPTSGWVSVDEVNDPSPTLEPLQNDMIPVRKEHIALKQGLAKWFLKENIAKLVLGADGDINLSSDKSSIAQLADGIDALDGEITPEKVANLAVTTIAKSDGYANHDTTNGQSTPVFEKHPSTIQILPKDISSAIEAAKQSLASAERWQVMTSKMLESAQREDDSAAEMVDKARRYLTSLQGENGEKKRSDKKNTSQKKSKYSGDKDKIRKHKKFERKNSIDSNGSSSVRGLTKEVGESMRIMNDFSSRMLRRQHTR